MYRVQEELKKELQILHKLAKETRERLLAAPKGSLRISNSHTKPEYYYKQEASGKGNGKYIKKKDFAIAIAIAQRDYERQLLNNVEIRIKTIEKFIERYSCMLPEDVYNSLNPYRRELVSPLIIPDDEYVRRWLAVEYKGKVVEEGTGSIMTEKGELVRSKSEKIIADKLFSMGIPYRYEYPIMLKSGIRVYPDFTILKMPERKEIYLEHFGLLDEESYVESTMRKLHSYSESGIFLGDNLLITYETRRYPLSTKMLDGVLQGIL